jgi:hypothetical protein
MTYKRKPKWCERCGIQMGNTEWHNGYRAWPSEKTPEWCVPCAEREAELAALHENIRRLKELAKKEGIRRVAEALVREIDKHKLASRGRYHERWAFMWEITGDHKALRKLVERLMPAWKHQVAVRDPLTVRVADVLQERGTATH